MRNSDSEPSASLQKIKVHVNALWPLVQRETCLSHCLALSRNVSRTLNEANVLRTRDARGKRRQERQGEKKR